MSPNWKAAKRPAATKEAEQCVGTLRIHKLMEQDYSVSWNESDHQQSILCAQLAQFKASLCLLGLKLLDLSPWMNPSTEQTSQGSFDVLEIA